MTHTRAALRQNLVEILIGMGEVTPERGAILIGSPDSNMDLAQLNFDSLTMLDFCLQVETRTQISMDPDELLGVDTLAGLEGLLIGKETSRETS